ncbi:hypothetical protein BCON_0214g00220 [Botryotinia convoluta]|uniref:Uncharacterized protein n=1 Tax=Botryotinia convoluta TaxID=54673 RepID=A0A4Z1HJQ3_9HELO|nr:hypothetical protein BCON_0214g00220 [Botryotinia convoluta]
MFTSILYTFLSVACTISAISWYVFGGSAPDTVSGDIVWLLPIVIPSMYSPSLLLCTLTLSPEELKERPDKIYILHSISKIVCALTINFVASIVAWAIVTELFSHVEPLCGKEGQGSDPIIWIAVFLGIFACIVFNIGAVVFPWVPYAERAARYSDNGWLLEFEILCVPFQNIKVRSPRHSAAEEEQTGYLMEDILAETSKSMKEDI